MRAMLIVLCCVLALAGCATTVPAVNPNEADAYIRTVLPRFQDAFNRGDWNVVSAFYTEDAVIMAPNSDIARGPAGARSVFAGLQSLSPRMSLMPERITQSCEHAYEYGRYEMRLAPAGAAPMTDRGKYVTVWQRMPTGEWKIAADIFNTSLPPPGM